MLLNTILKEPPKRYALLAGDGGVLQFLPLDGQMQSGRSFRFHATGIKFFRLVRDTIVATVAEDNHVVISQLTYGGVAVERPTPRTLINDNVIVRTPLAQSALDLLLFELLGKLFMLQSETQSEV